MEHLLTGTRFVSVYFHNSKVTSKKCIVHLKELFFNEPNAKQTSFKIGPNIVRDLHTYMKSLIYNVRFTIRSLFPFSLEIGFGSNIHLAVQQNG